VSSSSSPVISSTGTTPAMGASESFPEGGSGSRLSLEAPSASRQFSPGICRQNLTPDY
jgi:hypothetical protein